jgi:hypothetical protein
MRWGWGRKRGAADVISLIARADGARGGGRHAKSTARAGEVDPPFADIIWRHLLPTKGELLREQATANARTC